MVLVDCLALWQNLSPVSRRKRTRWCCCNAVHNNNNNINSNSNDNNNISPVSRSQCCCAQCICTQVRSSTIIIENQSNLIITITIIMIKNGHFVVRVTIRVDPPPFFFRVPQIGLSVNILHTLIFYWNRVGIVVMPNFLYLRNNFTKNL